MPVIEVTNLVKSFGSVKAVDDISFSVEEGAIFGFLGPNGAGKTTTINVLCTLLGPTSGSATLGGYDCMRESADVRRSIGIVFQDSSLDKDLTAYENLAFHAHLYGVRRRDVRARVEEALHFADLYDRRDDLVKKFSGGMKRRLEVARGLIHRPRVLFLDEPTIGLDPQSRANLWEYITALPREHNVTVFMTTHYMDEAEVCSTIAVMDRGKIIAKGSPGELKKLVGGDVVYLETTDNEAAVFIIRERLGLDAVSDNGELHIAASGAGGDSFIPELIRTLGTMVVSVRLQRPTLNDVFLKLTGKAIREGGGPATDTIKSEMRSYKRRHGQR